MTSKDMAPQSRRKLSLDSVREELKFLRSVSDVKYFCQKALFVLPRLAGMIDRWAAVPPTLQIEPTMFCNLDCITCCRSKIKRTPGNMDFKLFQRIIDDASQIGVKRVGLYLFGEPLLHPEIVDMIRYVKSRSMAFHLTTNGVLLTGSLGEAILRSGVTSADYLTVSMLGFSKAVHEKVMRGVSHGLVVDNLKKFLNNRKRLGVNGPVTETVFYSVPENEHELRPFLDHWGSIVDHAIDGGKAVEIFRDQNLPTKLRTKRCTQLWERMAVHWNGDVPFCGEDMDGDWIIGNLRENSIKEIWLGDKLNRFKKIHKKGDFDEITMCKYCDW
jgi:radical SAM protein with 4Fe4S-binding SPASM domain